MSQTLQFEFLAVAVGSAALVFLYIAYRFLASSRWVMGWIQGNFGLALLLFTGILVLAVMDIRTYRPMFDNTPIATLSFHTLEPGKHQLRLVNHKGIEQSYPVEGDQYQLVVNQFKWATRFSGMGMGHGYRIDHVLVLQDEKNLKTKSPVSSSEHFDVWKFFRKNLSPDFFISAHTVETLPRRVVDGAMYELIPDAFDIRVAALNKVAKEADMLLAELPIADETQATPPAETSVAEASVAETLVAETPVLNAPAAAPVAVKAPEKIPATEKSVVPAKPRPEELPGAHLQATPATVIEKPADPKTL